MAAGWPWQSLGLPLLPPRTLLHPPCRSSPRPRDHQQAFTVWAFTALANVASLMSDPLTVTGRRVTCKLITARSLPTVATGARQDLTRASRTTSMCSGHDEVNAYWCIMEGGVDACHCIRRYLDDTTCAAVMQALLISRLDYVHSLLTGLPTCTVRKLELVKNSAARLLTGTSRLAHITPVLRELPWLPVARRITYKVLCLVYNALHDVSAPAYCVALQCRDHSEIGVPNTATRSCTSNSVLL